MKKQNLLKTMAILTIATLFSGCGCKDKVHLYLPQDFKDCFVFPAGSWWVYSVNGEVYDTLALEKATFYPPIMENQGECEFSEYFEASYFSVHNNYFGYYSDGYHYKNSSVNDGDTVYYTLCYHPWYNHIDNYNGMFDHAFLHIKYFGAGLYGLHTTNEMKVSEQIEKGGGYWIEYLKDTLLDSKTRRLIIFRTVNFEILDDILKNDIDNLPPFRVYYARGIGLIRKEMYNGDVWQLENYFINK